MTACLCVLQCGEQKNLEKWGGAESTVKASVIKNFEKWGTSLTHKLTQPKTNAKKPIMTQITK